MKDEKLTELSRLFFDMKQIIHAHLPITANHNTWPRFQVLCFLMRTEHATMQDVAVYMRVKAPSATTIINSLARAGLVTRVRSKTDKRVTYISVNAKGRAHIEKVRATNVAMMRAVFGKLSDVDIDALSRVLRTLRDVHQKTRP